jgi:hypothetical protein
VRIVAQNFRPLGPCALTERHMTEATLAPLARETDALEEQFFSTPPPPVELEIEPWAAQPMGALERRAMKATLAMLGCALLAMAAFAAFSELVIVFPVPLNAAHAQLPEHASVAAAPPATPAPSTLVDVAAQPATELVKAELQLASVVPIPSRNPSLNPSAAIATGVLAKQSDAVVEKSAPDVIGDKRKPRAAKMPLARATRRVRAAPASKPVSRAQALIKRASSELGRGDAQEAQLLANQAILLDPTRARGYIVLAGARDALGDRAGKRAAFQACARNAQDALASTCRTLAR